MSGSRETKKRDRYILVGLAIGIVVFYFATKNPKVDITAPPIITTPTQYKDFNQMAAELSVGIMHAQDAGSPLSEDDKKKLRQAAYIYDGMLAYLPTNPLPNLSAGEIYQLLGEPQKAIDHFQAYIAGTPTENASKETLTSLADACWLLSDSYFELHNYAAALASANQAIVLHPEVAGYHVSAASALVQLNKLPEAKRQVAIALKLDPNNSRAKGLDKLLAGS